MKGWKESARPLERPVTDWTTDSSVFIAKLNCVYFPFLHHPLWHFITKLSEDEERWRRPSAGFRLFHGTPTLFDFLLLQTYARFIRGSEMKKKKKTIIEFVSMQDRWESVSRGKIKARSKVAIKHTAERTKLFRWINDPLGDSKSNWINLPSNMEAMHLFKKNRATSHSWDEMTVERWNPFSLPHKAKRHYLARCILGIFSLWDSIRKMSVKVLFLR